MPIIESSVQTLILWATVGYFLGAIPSGVILARLMNLGNLREIGSGNIGATNVLRTGNRKAAALTLFFDGAKGAAAVFLADRFAAPDAAQLAGLAAFVGHCFPIWLMFRGGKGVATYLGIIGMLAWPMGILACVIWIATAFLSRYSSLAALVTAGYLPIIFPFVGYGQLFILGIVLGLLIYVRHWRNIVRLRNGTESKIGAKT